MSLIKSLDQRISWRLLGIREWEAASIISKFVGNKKKVLNVGCLYGREGFFLGALGRQVTNLDLGKQGVPNMVVGDITKKTPFKDKEFDCVVMGEVLEHLYRDIEALGEVRRILKDGGHLVVTVPYHDDYGRCHVRMHSEKTVTWLLEEAGFEVKDHRFRGGLVNVKWVVPGICRLSGIFGLKFHIKMLDAIVAVDFWLGKRKIPLFRLTHSYGGYLLARKSKKSFDSISLNKKLFIKNKK